jgi:hypothetical protein
VLLCRRYFNDAICADLGEELRGKFFGLRARQFWELRLENGGYWRCMLLLYAFLHSLHTISFDFDFSFSSNPDIRILVDVLKIMYAIRDIFVSVSKYSIAYFSDKEALGWIMGNV